VIPVVLTPPLSAGPRRRTRALPIAALVGAGLVLWGVLATVVWGAAVSPYGFVRFSLADADRTITVQRAGTYVVFEEFPGAAGDDPTLPLEVSVIDEQGLPVEVTPLIDPTDPGAAASYRVPFHEGRAVAQFHLPERGRYLLRVDLRPLEDAPPGRYRVDPSARLALGRRTSLSWVGSIAVPLLGGVAPAAAGTWVLIRSVRARRRDRP
jgi:hypothetical protein